VATPRQVLVQRWAEQQPTAAGGGLAAAAHSDRAAARSQVLTLRANLIWTLPGASEAELSRALRCYAPLGPDPRAPAGRLRRSQGFDAQGCGAWLVSPCAGERAHQVPIPPSWPGAAAAAAEPSSTEL
jgi:hypothetical protein